MSMTSASSDYFQRNAGSWDALRAGYFDEAVRNAAIKKAYLHAEMVVADVGAGTGFIAAGLAPLVSHVHLVDGSPAMLETARKNLSAFENLSFHLADGLRLPFEDGALDAVFANMYLHHCPDPQAAITEMVRVLKPGGRLMITDMDAHDYAWLKAEMADEWQGFERGTLSGWFEQAGLVNAIVTGTGESCCAETTTPAITDAQGRSARISIFLATATRRQSMTQAVREAYTSISEKNCGCGSSSSTLTVETQAKAACCSPLTVETQAQGECCSPLSLSPQNSSACCAPLTLAGQDQPGDVFQYTESELSLAPGEAASFSLGCGNPTAMAGLKPGEVVVDIGSGGGLDAFIAAKRVGAQGRVIGVDMTPAMLERARASALRNGFRQVEFRQGEAMALPVDAGTVDVVMSNCVINLTDDKGKVFREAFRVLKPGGRLEVSDVVAAGAVPSLARADTAAWAECVSGALPEQEYLDLISQAGFEPATVRRSPVAGDIMGTPVYSVVVSARKPGGD